MTGATGATGTNATNATTKADPCDEHLEKPEDRAELDRHHARELAVERRLFDAKPAEERARLRAEAQARATAFEALIAAELVQLEAEAKERDEGEDYPEVELDAKDESEDLADKAEDLADELDLDQGDGGRKPAA